VPEKGTQSEENAQRNCDAEFTRDDTYAGPLRYVCVRGQHATGGHEWEAAEPAVRADVVHPLVRPVVSRDLLDTPVPDLGAEIMAELYDRANEALSAGGETRACAWTVGRRCPRWRPIGNPCQGCSDE
jgi:hypothetical protein